MNILQELLALLEWQDPGPPCVTCGKPHGSHLVHLVPKNSKVRYMNDDDEWVNQDIQNAEDHEYEPAKGYKELSQREAEAVGFDVLGGKELPADVYTRIERARNQLKRVGAGAGKLKLVSTK